MNENEQIAGAFIVDADGDDIAGIIEDADRSELALATSDIQPCI